MFASAGATLAAKFAFVAGPSVNIFGFILVSNLTGLILSAGQSIATQEPIYVTARDCIWGVLLGGLNFCGLAAFLAAIQGGELSMVACIGALSLLVPILLSSIIQKERLNLRQQTALWLSFLSVLVLATASR
jgi:drug/metabolite transporter (DMT)-like permease